VTAGAWNGWNDLWNGPRPTVTSLAGPDGKFGHYQAGPDGKLGTVDDTNDDLPDIGWIGNNPPHKHGSGLVDKHRPKPKVQNRRGGRK